MNGNRMALPVVLLAFLVLVVGILFVKGAGSAALVAGAGGFSSVMMPVISLTIAGLLVLFGVVTFIRQSNSDKPKRQTDLDDIYTVNELDEVVLGDDGELIYPDEKAKRESERL